MFIMTSGLSKMILLYQRLEDTEIENNGSFHRSDFLSG